MLHGGRDRAHGQWLDDALRRGCAAGLDCTRLHPPLPRSKVDTWRCNVAQRCSAFPRPAIFPESPLRNAFFSAKVNALPPIPPSTKYALQHAHTALTQSIMHHCSPRGRQHTNNISNESSHQAVHGELRYPCPRSCCGKCDAGARAPMAPGSACHDGVLMRSHTCSRTRANGAADTPDTGRERRDRERLSTSTSACRAGRLPQARKVVVETRRMRRRTCACLSGCR